MSEVDPLAVRASQQEVHEMRRISERAVFYLALTTIFMLTVSATAHAQGGVTKTGTLADGATYLIEVPANWNGTLFLYSHGYVPPGSLNPARDVGDPATRIFMLSSGFALAGSSYATTGWAIHEAIPDQIAVLDLFKLMVGDPKRTIAWGHSLGGMVTAALIQRHPGRFDAAQPMCGVLSGGGATWNTAREHAAHGQRQIEAAGVPLDKRRGNHPPQGMSPRDRSLWVTDHQLKQVENRDLIRYCFMNRPSGRSVRGSCQSETARKHENARGWISHVARRV